MIEKIDLCGRWSFCLDKEKSGLEKGFHNTRLSDSIYLPTTVSEAKKGIPAEEENTGYLTDPYRFEGYTWYSREVEFNDSQGKEIFLVLERTRISQVWIDGAYAGTDNSLCTSHRYRITSFIHKAKHRITVMVDNTSYPVKGGHMTSPDTQTNWNGITGGIYIEIHNSCYLTGVRLYPDAKRRLVRVKAVLHGAGERSAKVIVTDGNEYTFPAAEYGFTPGNNGFTYYLDETAKLWSEHSPSLYTLRIELIIDNQTKDIYNFPFGLRSFRAAGKYFEINGRRTFLRGKHDGLIFPMTGYAPTDLKSWMDVFTTAKSYGINHYRFHTCCPPDAAFTAADMFGIYLEPELPFWGTVTEKGEPGHDEEAQQYLIREGFRILDEFGNHPSFVMMSLGNELWGSKNRLNEILGDYKKHDSRHLYTQGSNNFQFVPCILDSEDFFCGVRFSRDRLFRGSYAMCDAPQGHIQTMPPDALHNYDGLIRPESILGRAEEGKDITIQYGTGTKTVKAGSSEELIPEVPVVSHEIGQYAMYPDYSEISRYTGVLKARNFEVFRRRLAAEGMLPWAEEFFKASGRLAAECYKAEIEAALRSSELAGFQLLDLQDFAGQGTALVGILNAFMENKGLISEDEWREFCYENVVLAELPGFVFKAGEAITIPVKLACFAQIPVFQPRLRLTVTEDTASGDSRILISEEYASPEQYFDGVFDLCEFAVRLPESDRPRRLTLRIGIAGTSIKNHYDLWIYPEIDSGSRHIGHKEEAPESIVIAEDVQKALEELKTGKKVLLFPGELDDRNSIPGTYCTDFWCYPMFRSISESMNKPVPIGTLGLWIDQSHPVFGAFPARYYTTPQWYDIVSNSRALRLDGTGIEPMVWPVDNFERNHRLGLLFELQAGSGRLLVCTSDLRKLEDSLPARWLMHSILEYMGSDKFRPKHTAEIETLQSIFMK